MSHTGYGYCEQEVHLDEDGEGWAGVGRRGQGSSRANIGAVGRVCDMAPGIGWCACEDVCVAIRKRRQSPSFLWAQVLTLGWVTE